MRSVVEEGLGGPLRRRNGVGVGRVVFTTSPECSMGERLCQMEGARSRFFGWWVAWAVGSEVCESKIGLCDQTLRRQGPVTGREFDNGDNMEMTESWSREKAEQTKLPRFPCECQLERE
jgi:hypothetical protein